MRYSLCVATHYVRLSAEYANLQLRATERRILIVQLRQSANIVYIYIYNCQPNNYVRLGAEYSKTAAKRKHVMKH